MTRQTNGMPELKYSEETFRDMYEALKLVESGKELDWDIFIAKVQQALAKAESK